MLTAALAALITVRQVSVVDSTVQALRLNEVCPSPKGDAGANWSPVSHALGVVVFLV